jgi:hypothetical protein
MLGKTIAIRVYICIIIIRGCRGLNDNPLKRKANKTMRQETINIYTIDDHPETELCFKWIRNNWHDLGQHIIDEIIDSLKTLSNSVNGKLDYAICIVPDRGEFVKLTDYDRDLLNELYLKRDQYPLTGVCYDHDVIEGLYNNDLDNKILNLVHKEGEYIYSDEGLRELCQANEYEFYENGEVI